jgi:hypothetical protein
MESSSESPESSSKPSASRKGGSATPNDSPTRVAFRAGQEAERSGEVSSPSPTFTNRRPGALAI